MRYIYLLFFIIFISGCSSIVLQPHYSDVNITVQNIDHRLAKRFSEYWFYRLHKQYANSYRYELPYQQYVIPLQEYKSQLDGYGKEAKVILYDIMMPRRYMAIIKKKIITKDVTLFSKDKWIKVDGEWYHKFFQNVLPPTTKEEEEFQ